jgi:hypothetical protein
MDKNQVDKREFTKLLNDRVTSTIFAVDLYRRTIGMNRFQLDWDKEGQITAFKDISPKAKQRLKGK